MPFRPGQTVSRYRIVRKIGQGGMGEVYLAEDMKLDRRVALKILPADVAADAGRLARFEREAKAVAALNHPHIVTLHSVEQADGHHCLRSRRNRMPTRTTTAAYHSMLVLDDHLHIRLETGRVFIGMRATGSIRVTRASRTSCAACI